MSDTSSREVFIRVDLRKLGITAAKVKMVDLLAGENPPSLKVATEVLKKGLSIKVDFPDGKMFLIDTK
jgi:hypothetical protein